MLAASSRCHVMTARSISVWPRPKPTSGCSALNRLNACPPYLENYPHAKLDVPRIGPLQDPPEVRIRHIRRLVARFEERTVEEVEKLPSLQALERPGAELL